VSVPIFRMAFAVALAAAVAAAARADEWVLEPSVSGRGAYNDNLQLLPSGGERAFGVSLSAALHGIVRTESRETGLELRATANRYPGKASLDTDDYSAQFAGSLASERSAWGLKASAVRDSTLQTELATTGVVLTRRQRKLLGVSPSYSRALSESLLLTLEAQASRVTYEPGAGLIDYRTFGASASLKKSLSERLSLAASASRSRYRADDINRSDTTAFGGSIDYAADPRLKLSLQASRQRTEIERRGTALVCPLTGMIDDPICSFFGVPLQAVTLESRTQAWTQAYSAGATWQFDERSSLAFVAGRDLNPTGSGSLVRTDRVGVALKRDFDERLSGSFDLSRLRSVFLDGPGAPAEYLRVAPALQWQVGPWWSISAGASYTEQRSGTPTLRARAREAFVSAVYAWPRFSVSR
jgi:hypothetical protein